MNDDMTYQNVYYMYIYVCVYIATKDWHISFKWCYCFFLNVHSTLRFHDSKPHKSNNRNRQSTTDNLDLGESCMFDEVSRYVHVNADQNL
jgi:hypothetical protein